MTKSSLLTSHSASKKANDAVYMFADLLYNLSLGETNARREVSSNQSKEKTMAQDLHTKVQSRAAVIHTADAMADVANAPQELSDPSTLSCCRHYP